MKYSSTKVFTSFFLTLLLIVFPQVLISQTKVVGQLSLSEIPSRQGNKIVTVNREPAEDGRSIMSPSSIATPANVDAKVTLPNIGSVKIAPNSRLNLSFNESSISGTLQEGEFIIYANPKITCKFSVPGGELTIPANDSINSFEVKIADGKTTVYSILGDTLFSGLVVPAGDFYPKKRDDDDKAGKKGGGSGIALLFVGIAGAVAAGAFLALSGSSDNSGNNNVSPVS